MNREDENIVLKSEIGMRRRRVDSGKRSTKKRRRKRGV